jgi:hypothetical protein
MSTHLDIDDVVAGHPVAERELKELRARYRQKLRLTWKLNKQTIKDLRLRNNEIEHILLFGK